MVRGILSPTRSPATSSATSLSGMSRQRRDRRRPGQRRPQRRHRGRHLRLRRAAARQVQRGDRLGLRSHHRLQPDRRRPDRPQRPQGGDHLRRAAGEREPVRHRHAPAPRRRHDRDRGRRARSAHGEHVPVLTLRPALRRRAAARRWRRCEPNSDASRRRPGYTRGMNRRSLLLALAALPLVSALPAAAQAVDVGGINTYLLALRSAEGTFRQTNPTAPPRPAASSWRSPAASASSTTTRRARW